MCKGVAEGRGQKAEGRRQKVEGRGQKAEGRGQRAEGRGQKGKVSYTGFERCVMSRSILVVLYLFLET